jgi:hypothetical protein
LVELSFYLQWQLALIAFYFNRKLWQNFIKKSIGLVNKLPFPSMVIASLLNATIGVNILMLNPLSPQLIPIT